jgi:hypothetical protein
MIKIGLNAIVPTTTAKVSRSGLLDWRTLGLSDFWIEADQRARLALAVESSQGLQARGYESLKTSSTSMPSATSSMPFLLDISAHDLISESKDVE